MGIVDDLILLLKKPFPQEESFAESIKIAASISVFVVLFLYVFKPFGIHNQVTGQFLICLGFGLVTFVSSMAYEWFIVWGLKLKGRGVNFTFGKWILYFIGVMFFISLANFLFIRIVLFGDVQWNLYPYMLRGTFAIGLFPTLLFGAFALLKQEKKYQNIASEMNQNSNYAIGVKNTNPSSVFDIPSDRIRYVEAMQNYVNVGYVQVDGEMREHTERATLKSVLSEIPDGSILRCHRSFLVNRDSIDSISGNAQGLILTLLDCEKQIPVSRSFISEFRTH